MKRYTFDLGPPLGGDPHSPQEWQPFEEEDGDWCRVEDIDAEILRLRTIIEDTIDTLNYMTTGFDGLDSISDDLFKEIGGHMQRCSLSRGGVRCSCGWTSFEKEKETSER